VLCLGEAARQLLAKQDEPVSPSVTASDRCLLCGESVTAGSIAACRTPYVLCHHCIAQAVAAAAEHVPEGRFVQVNF
jgi:hypothetical protein